MSMISDENQGELNADEQESLQIGEEMQEAQDNRLAGKYKNAEELEAAYIELQKKLGSQSKEEPATETEAENKEEEETESIDSSLFDRLWDESQSEFTEDTIKEIAESKPEDLAKMYLEYRKKTNQQITEGEEQQLLQSVGGAESYKNMMKWAGENLNENEIGMYDSVMDSGNAAAAYFAMQALSYRYNDNVGVDGNLLTGKAPSNKSRGFKSQQEVVKAMEDPRYDRDPAYRQEVLAKLENSNVNF